MAGPSVTSTKEWTWCDNTNTTVYSTYRAGNVHQHIMYADEKGWIAVGIKQVTKEKKVCTDSYKPKEQKYQTDAKMQYKTQNVIATYCGEI